MHSDLDRLAREQLAKVLTEAPEPGELDTAADMTGYYGLTSLNKIVFMMAVCDLAGVDLAGFTEQDVAGLRTLDDVVAALAAHLGKAV
jgi:acyl carrier protein